MTDSEHAILDEAAARVLRRRPNVLRDGPAAICGQMAHELARMLAEERRGGFDRADTIARARETQRAAAAPAHL